MTQPSIVSHAFIVRPLLLLRRRGKEPGDVAVRAGLDRGVVDDPSALFPLTNGLLFFAETARELDDPEIGLTIAADADLRTYGITGFLIANHPTFLSGLRDMERHVHRLVTALQLTVEVDGQHTHVFFDVDDTTPARALIVQDVLGGLVLRGPEATHTAWGPERVRLRQPAPADTALHRFTQVFGVTPEFGAAQDVLTYRTTDVEQTVKGADPTVLAHMHEAIETQVRKRRAAAERSAGMLELVGCTVDLASGTVFRAGVEPESLTSKERELLAFFAARPNRVVTHEEIETDLWGIGKHVLSFAPAVAIRRLRKKIEPAPAEPVNLLTVFGEGWKLMVAGAPVVPPPG